MTIDWLETPQILEPHVLQRHGCPIHYWTGGPAGRPAVVFLHGATMDHRMFNAQVPVVAQSYRVLVWDARGQGRSQPIGDAFTLQECADDLLAVLDQENQPDAIFVGQSLGGYIAQFAYLAQPGRVRALAVIGTTCIALPYTRAEVWTLKATLPLFNLWPYGHLRSTIAKNTALRPDVIAYAQKAVDQIARRDFLTIWKAVSLAVDEKGIPGHHIKVPFLLTHGDQDKTGSIRKQAPEWAAYEPDCRYRVIPDAGHNANQDNPAAFNAVLLDFLAETEAS